MVKNLPAMQETQGWEDPVEKGMATHSSILVWRIPCVHGILAVLAGYSSWGHKESDTTELLTHTYIK